MKKISAIIAALLLFQIGVTAQVRVLFIGNSYTYVNSLPSMFATIATTCGKSVVVDSSVVGGYRFQDHCNDATTMRKIRQGNWDYVILQEQSQIPAFSPSQVATDCFPFAKRLVDSIRRYSPCAEPVFYMTWGRRYGDASNCAFYPPICTYEGMSWGLRTSYLQMANDNDATVAPVGWAWRRSIQNDSNLVLHSSDNSHPDVTGTFLTAAVFYNTIFKSPQVSTSTYTANLPSAIANQLKLIADSVVFDSLSLWRVGHEIPKAGFRYSGSGLRFTFTDTSSNTIRRTWNFGDGTTDTAAVVTHTYSAAGPYQVTLTAFGRCLRDATIANITALSTQQLQAAGLKIEYGNILIPEGRGGLLQVIDVSGRVLLKQQVQGSSQVKLPAYEGMMILMYEGNSFKIMNPNIH